MIGISLASRSFGMREIDTDNYDDASMEKGSKDSYASTLEPRDMMRGINDWHAHGRIMSNG